MRAENNETHTKSLTDELPVCQSTGTGAAPSQSYTEDAILNDTNKPHDHSFQCQQIDDRICLYLICSGKSLAEFAKQKLVAELLFGQLNGCSPESVKDVLRQAFVSFEKDFLGMIDEYLTQELENSNGFTQSDYDNAKREGLDHEISIILALIHNTTLYICHIGKCRAILCKIDDNYVLRAVQLSMDYENHNNSASSWRSESILSKLEFVGPISLDHTYRFLVLMSPGLCQALQEIHANEQQFINRQLIQAIVQQFRAQSSLRGVAQSVIDRIVRQHVEKVLEESPGQQISRRPDLTLMIRNFSFPMPESNRIDQRMDNVTSNSIGREHFLLNSSSSSSDTLNPYHSANRSSTTSTNQNRYEKYDKNIRLRPYIDFTDYYNNIQVLKQNGTLPPILQFD